MLIDIIFFLRDTSLQILPQDDKDYEDCELQTDRQSDAGVVQEHFVASTTKVPYCLLSS
jgi:hypothetical protein